MVEDDASFSAASSWACCPFNVSSSSRNDAAVARSISILLRGCELALVFCDYVLQLLAIVFKDLGEVGSLRLRPIRRSIIFLCPEVSIPVERLLHEYLARFSEGLLTRLYYRRKATLRHSQNSNTTVKGLREGNLLPMAIS
jgi:hypothetical protein